MGMGRKATGKEFYFAEIQRILDFPIDHSFLNDKKELLAYGYQVGKISMKKQTVNFQKTSDLRD